ncbi:MAG: hypothetical protein MJZ17_08195 [Bacteroidales bacterium]|nr:hypothetical protein [Bacteroidales bacterium]
MGRVRKNYILLKTSDGKEPTLAGSFSSMKRAREAVKEDAVREVGSLKEKGGFLPNIEYRSDGGRLRLSENRNIEYDIKIILEDTLIERSLTIIVKTLD